MLIGNLASRICLTWRERSLCGLLFNLSVHFWAAPHCPSIIGFFPSPCHFLPPFALLVPNFSAASSCVSRFQLGPSVPVYCTSACPLSQAFSAFYSCVFRLDWPRFMPFLLLASKRGVLIQVFVQLSRFAYPLTVLYILIYTYCWIALGRSCDGFRLYMIDYIPDNFGKPFIYFCAQVLNLRLWWWGILFFLWWRWECLWSPVLISHYCFIINE